MIFFNPILGFISNRSDHTIINITFNWITVVYVDNAAIAKRRANDESSVDLDPVSRHCHRCRSGLILLVKSLYHSRFGCTI